MTGADHPPGNGSVVTWRRAQMVLLSAQGMDLNPLRENSEMRGPHIHETVLGSKSSACRVERHPRWSRFGTLQAQRSSGHQDS